MVGVENLCLKLRVLSVEKKYQVFVSSTFRDLKEQRQAVIRALLDLGHMPAGMELFPAADEDAWHLIQSVINESDYYLLIVGGRYGSLDEAGLGYTEKEYDYAIKTQLPVIAFLHVAPGSLARENTETDPSIWSKLEAFRKKVENRHHCKFWQDAADLHSKVVISLTAVTKKSPAVGWIRADQLPNDFSIEHVLKLEVRMRELEDELLQSRTEAPKGSEDFSQGDDMHKVPCEAEVTVETKEKDGYGGFKRGRLRVPYDIETTWNMMFAAVAPVLIQEAKERVLLEKLRRFLADISLEAIHDRAEAHKDVSSAHEPNAMNVEIAESEIETCLVQFRALGLIQESRKKRSVTDTGTYWALTPYGDAVMVALRAIRRMEGEAKQESGGESQ